MIYIDTKYIGLLSNRLERLKKKSGNTFNCRCPICGDSQTDKTKTRGYLYEKKGIMLYYCHNCNASMTFGNFLKAIDPTLHREYAQEKFIEKHSGALVVEEKDISKIVIPKFMRASPLKNLKKISQLEYNHPAKMYVDKRKIPAGSHYKLFYAPKFKSWVNTFVPDKFESVEFDEPRLIIPFLDADKNFFGLQGRSFAPTGIRYITIMTNNTRPKVFGLDAADLSKTTYITEGPIDSLFLPNALAMAGADVSLSWVKEEYKKNLVFVYDNEPRNKDIIRRMEKTIEQGYNVCIWPDTIDQKDINDMILAGRSNTQIKQIIDTHTYNNLEAKLTLMVWKKI